MRPVNTIDDRRWGAEVILHWHDQARGMASFARLRAWYFLGTDRTNDDDEAKKGRDAYPPASRPFSACFCP